MAVPGIEEGVSSHCTGTYTWRVENWTQLRAKKIYSPEFEIGGYLWRLLAVPRSMIDQRSAYFIAVYLEFQEAAYTPQRMCPKAKFELIAVKSASPDDSIKKAATHTFTVEASDWGFTEFIRRHEALNLRNGYLVNDALTLRVNIKIGDADPGLKSKFETGFVGIKSSGQTSLLSSLLQCLFHIEVVRIAVYEMSTVGFDDLQKPLPLALQELFYKLQKQNTSAKINDLIRALDWDLTNVRLRHDVQGVQLMLSEMLRRHDRAGRAKTCISELFKGQYSHDVQSPSMQETQTSKHSFMGITLDVLECKDIYASLEKFCQIDTLGENNHSREVEESKHYTSFDSFPPVLVFHLKRCYCNADCEAIIKMNSHYEFYDELDLDYNDRVLLSKNADQTIENKYRLHSVLVHGSGPGGGHYFTFIRRDEKWYKFDGEIVNVVPLEEAITEQYGDQKGTVSSNFSKEFESLNKSAAVMLIYIRKSEWERAMCDCGTSCLPKQIRECFDKERKEKEKRRKLKQEAHHYVNIKLATEFDFAEHIGKSYYFDLVDFDVVKDYRVHKKTSFENFKEMVSTDFGVPKHLQRFWKWSKRRNNTIRVSKPLMQRGIDVVTVLDLRYFRNKTSPLNQEDNALMTFKLFLESPKKASLNRGIIKSTLRPGHSNEVLIFLKYYDPELSKLSYLGHLFVEKNCPLCVIFEKAKKMAGLAPERRVFGFKEVQHLPTVVCEKLSPITTPDEAQLIQGDIIIIQKRVANIHSEYPTIRSFWGFIQNSSMVNFRPLKNPSNEGFELRMLKTMNYEQVVNALAKRLQLDDPKRLRLTKHNIYTRMPHWSSIKSNGIEFLQQMIMHGSQYTNILYYEVLHMQMPCLETLEYLTIGFHNGKGELKSKHQLMLPKDQKVSDVVKALKVELGEEYKNCDLRIMETLASKVRKVLAPESLVMELDCTDWIYRAEVIPEDQRKLRSDEYLVLFCHCKQEDSFLTTFGDPLWVKVKKGETIRDVKFRIQKTLEISDEEFSRWRIACHALPMRPVEYLENGDEILAKFSRTTRSRRMNGKFFGDNMSFVALQHEETRPNH